MSCDTSWSRIGGSSWPTWSPKTSRFTTNLSTPWGHCWHTQKTEQQRHWSCDTVDWNTASSKTKKNVKKVSALWIASWNIRSMCPGLSDELTWKIQGRQLSSTESSVDSTWTLHLFRRHASQQTDHYKRKTTPSSGKENNPMNPVCMEWGLPSRTLSWAQSNHQQMAQNASCPSVWLLHQAQWTCWAYMRQHSAPLWKSKTCSIKKLHSIINSVPHSEHLFLLGDFNTRVGDDHDSSPTCLGHYGPGKINENVCSNCALITTSVLPSQIPSEGLMETPQIPSPASVGPHHYQTYFP